MTMKDGAEGRAGAAPTDDMEDPSATPELVERSRLKRGDAVVELWTINRPERSNALSEAMVRRLGALAREAAADDAVRAVILTGKGGKAFCAGADLKERRGMSEDAIRDFLALYRTVFRFIDELPKPVIAAIDGVAFGGGLELALACDLRVMGRGAQVGLTEVSLAIIPGAGGTQRLTRLVGEARAKEMLLFSKRLDAAAALACGLVNEVTEEGATALDRALEWSFRLAEAPPIAVAAALEAVDAATNLPLDAGLVHELRCYERTLVSEDRVEALAAFAEKRPPRYRGR
jgi:enoyl-CoA hydratase/carnithine racemase